jgi:hypothetical protein
MPSLRPEMKEISTPQFEQFRDQLRYYDDKMLGNLSPFFEAKLLEIESHLNPASIVTHAFTETVVDKAEISQRSTNEIETAIKTFFSPFTGRDGRTSSAMADEVLDGLRACINLDGAKVWEYFPDDSTSDELYDYIAVGFTYVCVNAEETRCLILHGGYMD